ncbi:unnamed protein product [Bursaphelenchus xylophilus]|uniref:(pine wood nematode) hypothetical protein n=1 Tax=Bursaphelenchus xylophilus TaxID=6326 RepID=A0A1I7SQF0_BURXY|nr:unnamed protein product [Bursaphelenchus xylophilus]CAG9109807.1 unnamed protein product [Bursaphelenchus xylophilus]
MCQPGTSASSEPNCTPLKSSSQSQILLRPSATRLVFAYFFLFSLCLQSVSGSVLCRQGQGCETVSEEDLKLVIPLSTFKTKRNFGVLSTQNRRSLHPCRWKLCGAFGSYQPFANAMRKFRR